MKAALRVIAVNLAVLLAALLVVELIFGTWVFGTSYGTMNLPRNENRLIDVSQFVPGGTTVRYTRDQYGLRGDYGGDPSKIDVLALGGSTTDERYVTNDETWVARLQTHFRDNGKPLTIVNAAVDGQSSVGHIAALTRWLPNILELRPRYLIFYIGINDVAVDDPTPTSYDQIDSPSRSRRIRQYVANHSALYALSRTIRGIIQANRAQLMHGRVMRHVAHWIPVTEPSDPSVLRDQNAARLAAYASRIKTLGELSRKMGAEPIFVTQTRTDYKVENGRPFVLAMPDREGHFPSEGADGNYVMLKLFAQTTLTTCAEINATCVDLAQKIDFTEDDLYDAIHTTPAGSKRIADFLYGALADKIKPRG